MICGQWPQTSSKGTLRRFVIYIATYGVGEIPGIDPPLARFDNENIHLYALYTSSQ